MSKPSVIVIGAGMAGLSAAEHLVQNGITDVKLLEAKNRIGGRIHTCNFGQGHIELGANWIHGGMLTNSVYTLANQYGLLPPESPNLNRNLALFFRTSGRVIPRETGEKFHDVFMKVYSEADSYYRGRAQENGITSLGDFMKARLRLALEENCEDQSERKDAEAVFNCLGNYYRFHESVDFDSVDIAQTGAYETLPEPQFLEIPSGFREVLNVLADRLPPSCLRLQTPVVNVALWDDTARDGKVKVTCSNGERFDADHVIVTVPLGHLKANHKTLFTPGLPLEKTQAMDRLGFGKGTKLFLEYVKPFWRSGDCGIKVGWTDEEMVPTSVKEWWKRLAGFDIVIASPNVLLASISGPESEYIETLEDSVISETITDLLRKILANPSIPQPMSIKCSTWCTDEYTLGSYSYPKVGSRPDDRSVLREPITRDNTPLVLFAGEATDPHHYSTTHGARNSGLREADVLLKFHGFRFESKI